MTEKTTKKSQFDLLMEKLQSLSLKVDEEIAARKAGGLSEGTPDSPNSSSATDTKPPAAAPVPTEPPRSPDPPTRTLVAGALEHYKACPNCHRDINAEARKELAPDIEKETLQAFREKVKSIKDPVMCKGCGEIVERTTKECPNCHGTDARPIK